MSTKNFNDYLNIHHDTSPEKLAYNKIDYVIFSELIYLDLDEFIPSSQNPEDAVMLRDVAAHFYLRKDKFKKQNPTMTRDERVKIMSYLYHANRYKNVKVYGHSNIVDKSKNIQFSTASFQLDADNFLIVYRGTDDNLVGWKEDFYLAISDQVPAQEEALKYLKSIAPYIPDKKITLAGHSKGGNLAMYASLFAPKKLQENIKEVHAYDPVGFNKKLIKEIMQIDYNFPIYRYIPEESYVGQMMYYPVPAKIVKSRQFSLSQHATEYWHVENADFVYTDKLKGHGNLFNTILKRWSDKVSTEDFKRAIDIIFASFDQGNIDSVNQFFTDPLETITSLYSLKDEMDAEDEKLVTDVFNIVFEIINEELTQSVESDLEKNYQEFSSNVNESWQKTTENLKAKWHKLTKNIESKFEKN